MGIEVIETVPISRRLVVCCVALFGAFVVLGLLSTRPGPPKSLTDSGVLVSAEFEGPGIPDNAQITRELSGPTPPSEKAFTQAYCFNARKSVGHSESLDGVIMMGTSPRLIRVGELVSSGQVDARLADLAESEIFENGGAVFGDPLREAGFTAADLEEYLALRSQPPLPESADRYLVYVASLRMTVQRLVVADKDLLPRPRPDQGQELWAGSSSYYVVNGQVSTVEMDAEKCSPPWTKFE